MTDQIREVKVARDKRRVGRDLGEVTWIRHGSEVDARIDERKGVRKTDRVDR